MPTPHLEAGHRETQQLSRLSAPARARFCSCQNRMLPRMNAAGRTEHNTRVCSYKIKRPESPRMKTVNTCNNNVVLTLLCVSSSVRKVIHLHKGIHSQQRIECFQKMNSAHSSKAEHMFPKHAMRVRFSLCTFYTNNIVLTL